MSKESAKGRYESLMIDRAPYLNRARQCAALTIPSILPPEGHNPSSGLPQPYQGLGARGTLSLSARLATAILPPGAAVMRLMVPAEVLAQSGSDRVPPEIDNLLALTETVIHSEIERRQWRPQVNVSMQHLIVAGNVLMYLGRNNVVRLYRMDQYVVVRDPSGNLTELVICEELSPNSLSPALRELHASMKHGASQSTGKVRLYTWARLINGRWLVHQELEETVVPNSKGSYRADRFPFFALRYSELLGEPYGRGKIEEHFADLASLDGLTKAMLEGAAMASRNILLLRPNAAGGLGLQSRITQARNGEPVVGNPEDITMLQFTNVAGMQFVAQQLQVLSQEVAAAFLLNSAFRRDAERVTAYELRAMIEEIEGTLGGIYSTLSVEMMGPMIQRLIWNMQDNRQLPDWPEGQVEPVVLTGLDALGRERDVQRVVTAGQLASQLPPEAADYVKWDALLMKAFAGLGIPDAVRTPQEVEQTRQQRAMMEAATRAAPNVVNAVAQAETQQ